VKPLGPRPSCTGVLQHSGYRSWQLRLAWPCFGDSDSLKGLLALRPGSVTVPQSCGTGDQLDQNSILKPSLAGNNKKHAASGETTARGVVVRKGRKEFQPPAAFRSGKPQTWLMQLGARCMAICGTTCAYIDQGQIHFYKSHAQEHTASRQDTWQAYFEHRTKVSADCASCMHESQLQAVNKHCCRDANSAQAKLHQHVCSSQSRPASRNQGRACRRRLLWRSWQPSFKTTTKEVEVT
jgi:hypothetical protein